MRKAGQDWLPRPPGALTKQEPQRWEMQKRSHKFLTGIAQRAEGGTKIDQKQSFGFVCGFFSP